MWPSGEQRLAAGCGGGWHQGQLRGGLEAGGWLGEALASHGLCGDPAKGLLKVGAKCFRKKGEENCKLLLKKASIIK